jgi:glycosyltransferase involved in cell wall biosynthesis
MNISVIICAFKLERYHDLLQTIQSLCNQEHPIAEIVVVIDQNVTLYDQMASDAEKHNWRNVKLIFNEERKGVSYARNVGIRESSGDIVAFIDDDAVADPKWAKAIAASFAGDACVGAVTGLTVPRWESDSPWFPPELYWMISCSYVTAATTYEVERSFGTNMAFRRAVLDRTGLFNERLGLQGKKWIGGEDTELVWRVKQARFKILCNPEVRVDHTIPAKRLEFIALLERAFDGGASEGHMMKVTGQPVSPRTRREYLSTLLFEFFPRKMHEAVVHRSRTALMQALLVGTILIFWGLGFFYSYVPLTGRLAGRTRYPRKSRIALLGSRGIPAKYGGFETFAEGVAPALVAEGREVWVSCEGAAPPRPSEYKGVKLFYFPLKPFRRVFYETIYDIYSLLRASLTCDCVIMLGYGAGFFFFIPKLFRKKIAVNVDGKEWTRGKYNSLEKIVLRASELFALRYADVTIADSRAIQAYLKASRGTEATFIPYCVDVPASAPWNPSLLGALHGGGELASLESGEYYLIVGRLERENNIGTMVEGFLTAGTDKKLIIVGDFLDPRYQNEIHALVAHYRGHERVTFAGAIYENDVLSMLRQHCCAYLHGHSAGGTNPSLLEAMIARNLIIAHDNPYNREVCDGFALFFNDLASARTSIESVVNQPEACGTVRDGAFDRAKNEYACDRVFHDYEALLDDVLRCGK